MGRASRAKRERRSLVGLGGQRPIVDLDRTSSLQVLSAASVSPTAAYRQPTIAEATVACWHKLRPCAAQAGPDDLPRLLELGDDPRHATLEADAPLDARLGVVVRWGAELFRIAPGGWERPVALIEEARAHARFVDGVLADELGFGLVDLVEVGLRHMDEVLGRLSSVWPAGGSHSGSVERFPAAACLTAAEFHAFRSAPTIEESVVRCSAPERALRALRWATRRPAELRATLSSSAGLFGPVLAVADRGGRTALPVGFLLDGIVDSVATLTALALRRAGAAEQWLAACRTRTLSVLAGRGALLAVDPVVGGEPIVAVQLVDDGLLLAVDIAVAGVEGASIADAERRLARFMPGTRFQTSNGEVKIADRDEVVRLVVFHGSSGLTYMRSDDDLPVSVLPIEDLRWITTRSQRPEDTAMFLRDTQRRTADFVFSFGPFDMWEIWSSNDGSLYRGGRLPSALYIEPHGERAEWRRHAELLWLERALCALGARGLASWPSVEVDDRARAATVSDSSRHVAIRVLGGDDKAAIVGVRYDPVGRDGQSLAAVANGISWKFEHVALDLAPYVISGAIRIDVAAGDEADAVDVAYTGQGITLVVGDGIHEALADDSGAVEQLLGEAIASAMPTTDAERAAFAQSWNAAPPGIAVDRASPPAAVRATLSTLHPSLVTAAEQRIAEALHASGLEPGLRTGIAARDLEGRQIRPVAEALLVEALSPFDADALVAGVLADLEAVHAHRWLSNGHHARRAALAHTATHEDAVADDLVGEIASERSETAILGRTLALVVEEIVLRPPTGGETPTAFERHKIYALAHHLLHSGLRSETIHLNLSGTSIEISGSHEILLHQGTGDIDLDELQSRRAASTPPSRPRPDDEEEDDSEEPSSIVGRQPELREIDDALMESLGFGLDALMTVVVVLERWPMDDGQPVASVTEDEIVAQCRAQLAIEVGDQELRAASRWLTLTKDGLSSELARRNMLEHWELDRRAYRLATRPFVETQTGRLLVAPWGANMTRIIVAGNVGDGRLPWPEGELPGPVVTALKRYREARNAELERDVFQLLSGIPEWRVVSRVKKAKALGLDGALPGEIDVLAVDIERSRIWVIEVKDRTIAFSPRQIRTAIDEFNGERGYVSTLERKRTYVEAHTAAVAQALQAPSRDSWTVLAAMVTRRVEPAAFAGTPTVPYCTVETVAATVNSDLTPAFAYGALRISA